jgi:hypothetical protein
MTEPELKHKLFGLPSWGRNHVSPPHIDGCVKGGSVGNRAKNDAEVGRVRQSQF